MYIIYMVVVGIWSCLPVCLKRMAHRFFSSKEWPIPNFSKIFCREIPQKNGPFIIIHIKQFGKSHFSIWFLINNFDKNSSKEWTKPDFHEIFLKIDGPFF